MDTSKCLLRHMDSELCAPTNPIYIGLHGHNGKGGRVAAANVPKDYEGLLLADSPVRSSQPKIYGLLDLYAESLKKQFPDVQAELREKGKTEDDIRIKSLYLWSKIPGTGKTTTAVALLHEYLLRNFIGTLKRKGRPNQRPVYFLDVNELQTFYNEFNRPKVPDAIAERAANRYYSALEKAKNVEFAVFDDIGVRDVTDGFRGDLHTAINYRVTNQLPTVYTSNIPMEDLPHIFKEPRLADRMGDLTQVFQFEGKSHRGKRK